MCMKTKERMTICPTEHTTFVPVARYFTQKCTYFAETVELLPLFERWKTHRPLQKYIQSDVNRSAALEGGTCRAQARRYN